jgi:hypothetical protein
MNAVLEWATKWADVVRVFGVLATVIGFCVTIMGVLRSKTAAEQARQAAIEAKEGITRYDAIADLSAAMAIMEEIKRLQRHGVWGVLPDRYAGLRRHLVAIKSSHAQMSESQHQILQGTIGTFADLERRIEQASASGTPPPDPAKLNDVVAGQIDELHLVLLSLQRELRSKK